MCVCVCVLLWNTLINIIIAYTLNGLRDAVELNAYSATCFPKSVMFHSPHLYVLHLVILQVFRMARLVRPSGIYHRRFLPRLIFAVFGQRQRLISPLEVF